jgi:hypothetical protein
MKRLDKTSVAYWRAYDARRKRLLGLEWLQERGGVRERLSRRARRGNTPPRLHYLQGNNSGRRGNRPHVLESVLL